MVVFFVKSDENTYQKGRAHIQTYIVVPITQRGNYSPVILYSHGQHCMVISNYIKRKYVINGCICH